jgi:two-component system sensor histidine kinase BaeS
MRWFGRVPSPFPAGLPGGSKWLIPKKLCATDVGRQVKRWMGLAAAAAAIATLLLGWLIAWIVARQLVDPLKRIKEGTHLVRSGQLGSLVAVDRPDEIGDLARDFNAMVLQLKELDGMKRDFIAGVSHDFGTPLHAIRSACNYLQAGDAGAVTDKQAEYLLMISNSRPNTSSLSSTTY